MIVTLAGHVDHGKTTLVRELTGIDTDRLAQEKQRGLTIDLGFAYIDEGRIGFVDVPGHHKFIHNMVAGVASQQYAMLAIAADDGPMPQSREHLEILSLVGVKDGCIVITKCDRVGQDRLQTCLAEIDQLISGSFLENAPRLHTAADEPESFVSLLAHLRQQAQRHENEQSSAPFRMAIDRAFNVKGAGLVVTGTIHSGRVTFDDNLFHFDSNKSVRVRSIRAQDQKVDFADSGARCALNIAGLDSDTVQRGDWLTALPQAPCIEATLALTVTQSFPRAVRHWTPVHIYHASRHTTGRIALHDNRRIAPGTSAVTDLVCDEPLPLMHGEPIVLRDQSLDVTLGGGPVIKSQTRITPRRRSADRLATLVHYQAHSAEASLRALLDHAGWLDLNEFTETWPLDDATLAALCERCEAKRIDRFAISNAYWQTLEQRALETLEEHHRQDPSSPGLRANGFDFPAQDIAVAVLSELIQSGAIELKGSHFAKPNQQAQLPEALQRAWALLERELDQPQAPSTGDLAKRLQIPQAQLERDLKELTKRQLVVHVANHRFYLPRQLQSLAEQVLRLTDNKPMTVREFRDETGIGRNVAIEVLEYFDSRGFTRRQDNERVVTRDAL